MRRLILCRLLGRHVFFCWYTRGYGIAVCERCHNTYTTPEPDA